MKKSTSTSSHVKNLFPIVAIGAAEGGLEALEKFFSHMPADSGMAFVVMAHLEPKYRNSLTALLKNCSKMPICPIKNGKKLQPNVIYISPADKNLIFMRDKPQLLAPEKLEPAQLPIDTFFQSLAQQGQRIIGVILSGAGTDGTLGLRAIKEAGGRVIVQAPSTAMYDGMPRSAINTGIVDAVLPPEQIAIQFSKYSKEVFVETDKNLALLQIIFQLLRNRVGHDFSLYKYKTILRRIERRMMLHHIDILENYVYFLQQNPQEIDSLFHDLLIGVTHFFRDPEAFEALKKQILLTLIKEPQLDSFRIWVPGCARGEEVYSIAMLLHECNEELNRPVSVQIFGTDIDEVAINIARTGVYPLGIAADIRSDRLQRFFTKEKDSYSINKDIRKMVIFACQNMIKDPPFTKLDLLCCRNVLIYLHSSLQKKLLPLFHYSLKPNGILFLGTSETIGTFTDLFNVIDKRWKIFQRRKTLPHPAFITFPITASESLAGAITQEAIMTNKEKRLDIGQVAEKFLLNNYGPPCVIVNKAGDILYIYGRTGKYLEPAPGKVRFNVLEMARADLKTELVSALHQVTVQHKEIIFSNLQIKDNDGVQAINLKVSPLTELEVPGLMIIIFEPVHLSVQFTKGKKLKATGKWAKQIADLERELQEAKKSLQLVIEEHKLGTEELQSTNEELQSNNEEIETSKEELQSLNEELETVNSELQTRIDQLSLANDDMKNLLDSTEIATLFLDNNLCIKRFTAKVTQLINLIPADIGRPLSHIVSHLNYETLATDAHEVLKTLRAKNIDVKTKEGIWYSIHIIPYRTTANLIDGVVMTFLNVHEQKQVEEELQRLNILLEDALDQVDNILATISEPFVILDSDFRIVSANLAFYQTFKTTPENTLGQFLYELDNQQWNIPKLRTALSKIILQNIFFEDFEVSHTFPTIGNKNMLVHARKVIRHTGKIFILLSIRDITDYLNTEKELMK